MMVHLLFTNVKDIIYNILRVSTHSHAFSISCASAKHPLLARVVMLPGLTVIGGETQRP